MQCTLSSIFPKWGTRFWSLPKFDWFPLTVVRHIVQTGSKVLNAIRTSINKAAWMWVCPVLRGALRRPVLRRMRYVQQPAIRHRARSSGRAAHGAQLRTRSSRRAALDAELTARALDAELTARSSGRGAQDAELWTRSSRRELTAQNSSGRGAHGAELWRDLLRTRIQYCGSVVARPMLWHELRAILRAVPYKSVFGSVLYAIKRQSEECRKNH